MSSLYIKGACEKERISYRLFIKRYVDDTLAVVKDIPTATAFLATLNEAHPTISFTMEVSNNNKLPFIGMELIKIGKHLKTRVYRKTTNKGLLLHYQSHVDACYKQSLLMTMLNLPLTISIC